MNCIHCHARNEEDERRCVRCGRRLHAAADGRVPDHYPLTSATAPALEALPGGVPLPPASAPTRGQDQPLLFRDPGTGPKVIPIPMLTPSRPQSPARKSASRPQEPRANGGVRRRSDSQQSLNFQSAPEYASALGMQVEGVIYCDAPVALPVHRLMAAAVDGSMIAIALALFLAIFYFSGGHIAVNKQTIPLFAGVIAAIALFYRVLWCLADADSPGMRAAGLRLVNFDGRVPDRDQRGLRQGAYLLSLLSAGLGLIWALVDEENLTWHDHISKTFPTSG